LYKSIEKLYGRARDNLDLLYNVENPDQGALGCYDTPDQCTTIADNIMANLVPITADDLSFFGDAQYVLPSEFGTYFYFGSGWNILPNPPESNGLCFHDLVSVTITNSSFTEFVHYSWNFVCQGGSGVNSQCNAGTSSDGMFYKGTTSINDGPQCGNDYVPRDWTKIVSPFYFQAYNSSDTSSLNEYLAGSDE